MKYLGFLLDDRWSFVKHFNKLASRLGKRADALMGLMPNFRSPGTNPRRAYFHEVMSKTLYSAPVWCEKVWVSRKIQQNLHTVQRRLDRRIARAYRIVYKAAVMVLAVIPTAKYMAEAKAKV
ncbi:uncharacterized protein LOC105193938 [Solenopsis invicta]|uniref:uncharacterized protein LOC105193938 n=1 Tax=Solenopsis invicta TaxID=13686 RepID=UPI000595E6C2|nr:uncharacterized protein LOC105193938 [Solenopsis invicta]